MGKRKVAGPHTAMILVASVTLMLGRDKETGERNSLAKDAELTEALVEKYGLSDKDVQSLVDDGKLVERTVRAAAPGGVDPAELAAEKKRADDAEADYAELEKHVEKLEAQIKEQGEQIDKLTAELSAAPDVPAAGKGATKA